MDSIHLCDFIYVSCQFISVHMCNCQGVGIGVPGVSSKSWRYLVAWLNLYNNNKLKLQSHVVSCNDSLLCG